MSIDTTVTDAARAAVDTAAKLQATSEGAVERAGDVGLILIDALDDSLRTRPYTTLLAAAGIGFLFAVLRRH